MTIDPATGESTVTVTVDVDEASARWVETETTSDAVGIVSCQPSLEVDATVTLELAEGPMVSELRTTLTVEQELGVSALEAPSIRFSVDAADVGDWVTITTANSETITTLIFTVAPLQQACAGEVQLWSETPSGTGGVVGGATIGGAGSFASWSDSGCGVDELPVNLDEPYHGLDLRAAVEQAFGDVQLSGAWEDGGTTTMNLKANVTSADVCGYALAVVIPVDIVAETADARIVSLSAPGTVHAVVHGERLVQLGLWLSEELQCESETSLLPYRSADCADVDKVTAQLGFAEYFDDTGSTGGQVELYVVGRDDSAASGAVDRVDRLILTR